ncbi:PQQ-like beta-propeller repeat protein [Planctomicrobium sp.]|nr:PQQ-binding-like beta-propeller repeat protein [Planctomicrobium sp.]MDB4743350.1 PQQ-like beta-propeller repeat protein [Planctomicrobium sp.]
MLRFLNGWLLLLSVCCPSLSAGDWPQILGETRNGIASADEKLLDKWPKEGPQVLWEREVGHGYAGLAVKDRVAILFHRDENEEAIEALDLKTGETLWKNGYATTFYPQVGGSIGDGPLCVPAIADGKVITFGAQGVLTCTDLKSGDRLWQVKTHDDFQAREGYFGAGSSPIVIDGNVIVNVGGSRQKAGIVAFALADGEVVWQKTEEPASYAAPASCTISGIEHVLIVTRYKCSLLDAKSGALRFQFPFGQRGPTVNAATPIVVDDHFLVTSSYGIGSVYAEFNLLNFETIWKEERALASQYCTPIHRDGFIYVIDGRDDQPPADLKCLELSSGKVQWTKPDFGYGTILAADDKFLICKTNGELLLAELGPSGAKILSKARPLRGTVRALPALSEGCLLIRDQSTLKCLAVAPGL